MFRCRKVDVLILIEHKARELETAVLLKTLFERKGYSVIIDSIKFHKESIILKYKPSIAIVPWAYSNKEMNLFRNFKFQRKNENIIILNMHHEQISNEGSDAFILPKDDAKKILHVSWGRNFTNKLIEAGCLPNSIIECGNPRLDFYRGKLTSISNSKEVLSSKYDIDKTKKWALFIANSFHLLSENQIEVNIEKGVDIKEQIEKSIKNRNDFLNYVDDYLAKNNDVIFIYRPHPSFAHLDAKCSEIIELCSKYENFKCISENSIRDWIINSDIAISFHSTSIIECAVSNTPFYLFRTHELPSEKDYAFFKNYNYTIKNYEDFCKAIKNPSDFSFNIFNKAIKEYIDIDIDKYASEQIVDFIAQIDCTKDELCQQVEFRIIPFAKTLMMFLAKKMLLYISKVPLVKNTFIKSNDIRFYNLFYTGDDYFDQSDINIIEAKIKVALNKEF